MMTQWIDQGVGRAFKLRDQLLKSYLFVFFLLQVVATSGREVSASGPEP